MTNPHLALVSPSIIIGTVDDRPHPPRRRPNADVRAREYLTDAEVSGLIAAAGRNHYGHRDATMVLVAYRHGLRAAELWGIGVYNRRQDIRPWLRVDLLGSGRIKMEERVDAPILPDGVHPL